MVEEILEELLERRARRELRPPRGATARRLPSGFTVCVVEMLTTDGSSFSARSANPSGAGRATAGGTIRPGWPAPMRRPPQTAERRNRDESNDTLLNSSQQKPDIARPRYRTGKVRPKRIGGGCRRAIRPGREATAETRAREITREAAGKPDPFAAPPHQRRNSQTITTPSAGGQQPGRRAGSAAAPASRARRPASSPPGTTRKGCPRSPEQERAR